SDQTVLSGLDRLRGALRLLDPQNNQATLLRERCLALSDGLMLAAAELLEQDEATVPVALMSIVDIWLALTLFAFARFAPFNRVSCLSMASGAAAIAMALFVIVEMNTAFVGFISVSPKSMDAAIVQISQS